MQLDEANLGILSPRTRDARHAEDTRHATRDMPRTRDTRQATGRGHAMRDARHAEDLRQAEDTRQSSGIESGHA